MAFSFLTREAGRVHVCGHRGYSLHYPENTLPAFAAAKAWGATTIEIDVVLTAEGEPIVLHDRTLDRTTDGHGFAADFALEPDPPASTLEPALNPRFAGTRIPTLSEVVNWGRARGDGDLSRDQGGRAAGPHGRSAVELLEASGITDRPMIISFDHVVLEACG